MKDDSQDREETPKTHNSSSTKINNSSTEASVCAPANNHVKATPVKSNNLERDNEGAKRRI